MPGNNDSQPRVLLDWFNITYRTLYILVLVLVIVGGGAFYFLRAEGILSMNPTAAARREVSKAERLLVKAGPEIKERQDEGIRSLGKNAEVLLEEARQHLKMGQIAESRSSALQSQLCSQKILDFAKGEPTYTVRLYKVEGDVRVKPPGSFLWERADTNRLLSIGDQVKTASNGSAQIVYFDGTITTVKPGSLLEIKELYEDPSTKIRRVREQVTWGKVTAKTERRNVKGSFHEVSTENAVARTEDKANFEVEFDQVDNRTRLRVQSGQPELTTAKTRMVVHPQELVEVDRNAKVGQRQIVPLAPKPLEPIDQRTFLFEDPAMAVTVLRWEQLPGVSQYRLQLSNQSLFGKLLLDKRDVRHTTVKLPKLPVGSYYWRVLGIKPTGEEGSFSEVRKFRIRSRSLRDYEDHTPPPLDIIDFLPSGPLVIINGKTEPGAVVSVDRQKVDVYEDGSFTAVIRLQKEGLNHLKIRVQDSAGNTTSMTKLVYVESF